MARRLRTIFWVVAAVDGFLCMRGAYDLARDASDPFRYVRILLLTVVGIGAVAATRSGRDEQPRPGPGTRVVLWVAATLNGLLFVDVLITKVASGDMLAYLVIFGAGGAAAACATIARSRRPNGS